MSLDLEKLERNLDEALENETPESLKDWLDEKRRKNRELKQKYLMNIILLSVLLLCLFSILYVVIFENPKYLIMDILFIFWTLLNIPELLVWIIYYHRGEL